MARNIEIKCKIEDALATERLVIEIAGKQVETLHQEDVFYKADRGKLKLRIFPDGRGDLISYSREEKSGPKLSDYSIYRTRDAMALRQVLDQSFQIIGVVRKERKLFLKGRTRIHLDSVENLGEFLELEVVLQEGESLRAGKEEASELMEALHLSRENLCEKAYIDFILERNIAEKQ